MARNVIEELVQRGLYSSCTDVDIAKCIELSNYEKISEILEKKYSNLTVYCGFDATAPSLHIGNLTTLMMLRLFKKHRHNVITLIGGATTKIGDPSGKDEMRKVLSDEVIDSNKSSIIHCILNIILGQHGNFYIEDLYSLVNIVESINERSYWRHSSSSEKNINWNKNIEDAQLLTLVDNAFWFKNKKYIDFLREIGHLFSINKMLTMDSIKLRLERQQNLSFLEFNYMILQSYDFWYLSENFGCNAQIGGSDQWGNIVSGIDLVRRKNINTNVLGITAPLITLSDGKKMGKSEQGAVWLHKDMLSSFDYFQYFRNVRDEDVKKMFLIFTDIPVEKIKDKFKNVDNINKLKIELAFEATKICRGEGEATAAKSQAEILFIKKDMDLDNVIKINKSRISVVDLLVDINACPSKSEARKLIMNGGIRINDSVLNSIVHTFECEPSDISIEDHQFAIICGIKFFNGPFKLSIGKKRHFTILLKS